METPIYAAITGMNHYFGSDFLKPGLPVQLVKDPGNAHDDEAIAVQIAPIGKIGYIANSPYTVPRGCRSAGRIYDSFDRSADGIIRFVFKDMAIVELILEKEEAGDKAEAVFFDIKPNTTGGYVRPSTLGNWMF